MKRFSLVLRPVTESTPFEQYAERVGSLVKKPDLAPTMEHYYPGVVERYSDPQSGAEALQRMAEKQTRKEAAAYLLILTTQPHQKDIRESYNHLLDLNRSIAGGLGVPLHGQALESTERIVGMGTTIYDQTLVGVRVPLQPNTWLDSYGWTHLTLWADQTATYDIQRRFAECLTGIAPPDSFITISESHRFANRKRVVDPNGVFDVYRDFILHSKARPKGTKQAKADGVVTDRPTKTYLKRKSKVQRRIAE